MNVEADQFIGQSRELNEPRHREANCKTRKDEEVEALGAGLDEHAGADDESGQQPYLADEAAAWSG